MTIAYFLRIFLKLLNDPILNQAFGKLLIKLFKTVGLLAPM